ncbi:hypothetical protein NBRC110019_17790 [Neptunitalea chrysea]|uniref:Uncharacterized protein n=1 Tax=Neptunitalea chrysea TaxID=1647581 RepID=A0A9W6B7N6_9FLAO|nr:hypothetical protein [Neptunitalea chrysea]GLB52739.1 hypothetical protein NBRC110019_17790 [Neptunitalea chrysea]
MKQFLILGVALLVTTHSFGQKRITPGDKRIISQRVQNEHYAMLWSMVKGDTITELGKVLTEIKVLDEKVLFRNEIKRNGTNDKFVDSTIVSLPDMAPIYHFSDNAKREIVINYGENVEGYYIDKSKKEKLILEGQYPSSFDSSMYPQLIRCLPLSQNYTADLLIFNFDPEHITDVVNAYIKSTSAAVLNNVRVWDVTVKSDISDTQTHYYIDSKTYEILKIQVSMPNDTYMIMERIK